MKQKKWLIIREKQTLNKGRKRTTGTVEYEKVSEEVPSTSAPAPLPRGHEGEPQLRKSWLHLLEREKEMPIEASLKI